MWSYKQKGGLGLQMPTDLWGVCPCSLLYVFNNICVSVREFVYPLYMCLYYLNAWECLCNPGHALPPPSMYQGLFMSPGISSSSQFPPSPPSPLSAPPPSPESSHTNLSGSLPLQLPQRFNHPCAPPHGAPDSQATLGGGSWKMICEPRDTQRKSSRLSTWGTSMGLG